MNRWSERG